MFWVIHMLVTWPAPRQTPIFTCQEVLHMFRSSLHMFLRLAWQRCAERTCDSCLPGPDRRTCARHGEHLKIVCLPVAVLEPLISCRVFERLTVQLWSIGVSGCDLMVTFRRRHPGCCRSLWMGRASWTCVQTSLPGPAMPEILAGILAQPCDSAEARELQLWIL